MEKGDSAGDSTDGTNLITITVKFSGRSIPITISVDSTVKDLKSLLQPLTNVLTRGQKLIYKGKLLVDEMMLGTSEISSGAKIMLMASQGLHQGDGPIKKEAPVVSNLRKNHLASRENKVIKEVVIVKSQAERWKATGVVALSENDLKHMYLFQNKSSGPQLINPAVVLYSIFSLAIPPEVWNCGSYARVLDLNHNLIQELPVAIGNLISLQKLFLNANCLVDQSISWEGLSSLRSLTVLSLSQNLLTSLPSALGALTCLKQLHVANNRLTCLPTEIGLLVQLQVLEANNNRITTIPSCIGSCTSLVEVDFSSNLLVELPETLGNLINLKALHLDNNGLKSLPTTLLKNCVQLSTLDLHGTELTMDILRQLEGWESFDQRRLLKHQKQLAFRVEGSAYFDEGADKS